MHGLSNDFIILDLRGGKDLPSKEQMVAMMHRKTGVGCDSLQTIHDSPAPDTTAEMRIFNYPDASEAEACGNATRCVASYLMKDMDRDEVTIRTLGGLLKCRAVNKERTLIEVDMGVPRLAWQDIPLSEACDTLEVPIDVEGFIQSLPAAAVNMGNPHCVFFIETDVEHFPVREIGPKIEHHPLFPRKTNVEFANVLDRKTLRMRVWERDTGETEACGSGACATAVAAIRHGLVERTCTVILNGGPLQIHWRDEDDHLLMTGDTAYVFEGALT